MAEPSEAESEAAVAETDSAAAEPSEAASDSADAKAALSPDWAVQGGKLGWSTNWSGSAIQGNFRKWTAQIRFDPDVWIVETEDRAGRHFLDLAKT